MEPCSHTSPWLCSTHGNRPRSPRPRPGALTTAPASSTTSRGRWIILTSGGRRTESKQRRIPLKGPQCGEGAAAGDDRTRQCPQGHSSRQLLAHSGTEVGEQLGGTVRSCSPLQPAHSHPPSMVLQRWGTVPHKHQHSQTLQPAPPGRAQPFGHHQATAKGFLRVQGVCDPQ